MGPIISAEFLSGFRNFTSHALFRGILHFAKQGYILLRLGFSWTKNHNKPEFEPVGEKYQPKLLFNVKFRLIIPKQ